MGADGVDCSVNGWRRTATGTVKESPHEHGSATAIDPGPNESAWVRWNGAKLESFAKEPNEAVLDRIRQFRTNTTACVIEQVAGYGMPVGAEVFETVFWSGRFAEAYGAECVHRVPRLAVKMNLCHDSRFRRMATSGNLSLTASAGKKKHSGRKAHQGRCTAYLATFGLPALAVTWCDQQRTPDVRELTTAS